MSSLDCKSQTTNIYNFSKPHTIGETTVTSSVSRYKHQFSNRTQNHYSTDSTLTTVNTGMYWYKLIIYWTWLYIWVTLWVSYEKRNFLPFASTSVHPRLLVGSVLLIFLVFCVVLLCVFILRCPIYVICVCFLIVVCTTYCLFFVLSTLCWQSLSPATDRIRLDPLFKWTPDHPLKHH